MYLTRPLMRDLMTLIVHDYDWSEEKYIPANDNGITVSLMHQISY